MSCLCLFSSKSSAMPESLILVSQCPELCLNVGIWEVTVVRRNRVCKDWSRRYAKGKFSCRFFLCWAGERKGLLRAAYNTSVEHLYLKAQAVATERRVHLDALCWTSAECGEWDMRTGVDTRTLKKEAGKTWGRISGVESLQPKIYPLVSVSTSL